MLRIQISDPIELIVEIEFLQLVPFGLLLLEFEFTLHRIPHLGDVVLLVKQEVSEFGRSRD